MTAAQPVTRRGPLSVVTSNALDRAWQALRTSSRRGVAPGAYPADARARAAHTVEVIRAALYAGRLRLSPWAPNYADETAVIRGQYRKMLREGTLKAAHNTKVLSVAAQDLQCQPAEDDDGPRAADVAAFGRWALRQQEGGTREMVRAVLTGALLDGFSVCVPVWRPDPVPTGRWAGKRVLRCLKPYDVCPEDLEVDAFRNVTGVWAVDDATGEKRLFPVDDPRQPFVVFSHLSLYHDPAGVSDHRAPYRAFWIKDTVWQLRSLFLEKFSGPFLRGTFTDPNAKAALEEALENAKSATWVSVPAGAMVDAIDFSTRGTADYEAALKDCDREMLVGTVGAYLQILEGQVADGRGDTQVHKEISELFQWYLSDAAAGVITEQVLPLLTETNFAGARPPACTLGGISDTALGQRADLLLKLQQLGLPIPHKATREFFGVQEPADPADVLTPAAPAGGPGGTPAGPFAEGDRAEPPFVPAWKRPPP